MIRKLVIALSACALSVGAHAQINDKQFEEAFVKFVSTEKGQEALGNAIQEYSKRMQARAAKEQEDRQKAELENQFKNPVKIDVGSSPVKGSASAKVTVIEFSDFQCPYCKRGRDVMESLLKEYPNDVKVVFKNMPLGFHPNALPAAKAALAANKQGKFWEYHDGLFENQEKLSDEYYVELAKKLNLDVTKFKADMASAEIDAQVKDDMKIAAANGVQGTPGFFVGGVAVRGAYPLEYFKGIVDRHLGKTPAAK